MIKAHKTSRLSFCLVGLAAGALVSGCVLAPKEDFSSDPNYSVGYNDGCATGNSRVTGFKKTITRNEELFKDSDAYKSGWKAGYSSCGGTEYRDKDVFGGEDRWYESGTLGSTQ